MLAGVIILLVLFGLSAAAGAAIAYFIMRLRVEKARQDADQRAYASEQRAQAAAREAYQRVQVVQREAYGARDQVAAQVREATQVRDQLHGWITSARAEAAALEESADLRAYGFYAPRYNFESATAYAQKLARVRGQQRAMLTAKKAATCSTAWTVNGSAAEGRKQINQTLLLIVRAFNGESDSAIARVKHGNVNVMETRIQKSVEAINKLAAVQQCAISPEYLRLKLEELYLVHEYEQKLQAEREEQREIRERMRDEEQALREAERMRRDAERDEDRYRAALARASREVEDAVGARQDKLLAEIARLEEAVAGAEAQKARATSLASLTKFGTVYVLSNIGAFGENVYKIGMTRRYEPRDRVDELSSASVPFPFDVHALITTTDAPALENALHKRFHERRVNAINLRKEFFSATIDEIADAAMKIHGVEFQLTKVAEAAHYRQTLARRAAGVPIGTPLPPEVETGTPSPAAVCDEEPAPDYDEVDA